MVENESGTKKLRLYGNISVVAFIAMLLLLVIVGGLNGTYGYSPLRTGILFLVAGISFSMPILTLVEIHSLKKKNGGTPIGKTGGKKFLSIVFLIISYIIMAGVFTGFMHDDSTTPIHKQKTISYSEVQTATEDTVWSPLPIKDEFGDQIDGQYELDGLFQDDEGRTVVVAVIYNDELGPIIALSTRNSIGTNEAFFYSSQPVELKMKVGNDVYQYRLFVANDATTLYLMDYYSYVIQQYDAISEARTGEENNISGFMEQLDEMAGGKANETKSLYDVRSMISLLYNGQEDIRSVISSGTKKYSFIIQPANFKSAFDNIWDYSEVCAENDELEKKYNNITKEIKESVDDSQVDDSKSSENSKVEENDPTEDEADEDSVSSLDIEFPQCPINFTDCGFTHYSIRIDSFKATTESVYGGQEIRINYEIKGTTSNASGSAYLKVMCYDSDGYAVDTSMIKLNSATASEPFKIKDDIVVDASTARIEFAAP